METEKNVSTRLAENRILTIRGKKVMLDADLAALYGVTTSRLNEQVKRNVDRFPDDFMFRLTEQEKREVIANCDHLQNLRYSAALPNVFTEHGALMAASVLNTPRAVAVSVYVVRAFVRLREAAQPQNSQEDRLRRLEDGLNVHDRKIAAVIAAIRQLMTQPKPPRRRIGFREGSDSD